jgi:XTP/dITP diphosphohydrolase
MPFKLLLATRNAGKRIELQELLGDLPVHLLIAEDVGLSAMDVPEDSGTVAGNATLKARAYAQASGLWTLADDTGLFVDALDGAPGVDAAYYGGPDKLLDALQGIPTPRTAHFECVIVLCSPDGQTLHQATGICPGQITTQRYGSGGFGYDSVFLPDGHTLTFGQMPHHQKNPISHRGRAILNMLPTLHRLVTTA